MKPFRVTRLALSLRSQLKEAREANERLRFHVARQDAELANLQADIAGYERMTRALMETAPSTIEELDHG